MSAAVKRTGPWIRCCNATRLREGATCRKCGRVVTAEDLADSAASNITPLRTLEELVSSACAAVSLLPRDFDWRVSTIYVAVSDQTHDELAALPGAVVRRYVHEGKTYYIVDVQRGQAQVESGRSWQSTHEELGVDGVCSFLNLLINQGGNP